MPGLFRQQVMEKQADRLHGEILLLPRLSHTIILSLLLAWVVAVIIWLAGSHYARKESVSVNFTIEPGETVAIVGPSDCGKTTLLKCLMGLLEPTEGEILIDGRPLKQLPNYRSQIAGVMQDDQLLAGTVGDNIACFEPQVDLQRIVHCANMACIHEEIMRMPMEYNTLVGDMGTSLSGGQKQRIVLARASHPVHGRSNQSSGHGE
ncbi:ATP-binding cassette domain-containing protein [Microbulbifer spongiae]|uniref:ATP-binding cassette domain-containing protein n=1 Tax=Microbulbifer spongiae TaxID=2944933 RepID=A0ABY9E8C4_9GAMM|nr:ATP-binding cassette domain-containing protein [Microbulbifer sp. MI-G]WKD48397.1 ATP-binding cassette domain-containing protein [Microbulbifer sp. MI-G]